MGAASYQEDILRRFFEATETTRQLLGSPAPPRHYCPFCNASFTDRYLLSDHLSTRHTGSRPVLVIAGIEPNQISTFRQTLRPEQIAVENCTAVRVRFNGVIQEKVPPQSVAALLSRQNDADVCLDLFNRFDEMTAPITQSYNIGIRIPPKESLDAVDRAFIRHLANSAPQMSHVAAFLKESCCHGVARDYADALGSYVRGLLVKDQAVNTGVTLTPDEVDELYGYALVVLKEFQRPLSVVVCGLIRFAFNDFTAVGNPTGFRRLDWCNSVLGPLAGRSVHPVGGNLGYGSDFKSTRLCPLDQAIDRVLDLSERLRRQTRWGPTLLEDCRQAAHARTLGARDRVKILALWAAEAVRLRANMAALEPLRQLRATYPFGAWASEQLDE